MALTNAVVSQANSDAGTDNPATWRSDINTGTGYLNQLLAHFAGPETDLASAATMDIGAGAANRRRVTGTTTVTSLGTAYTAGFVLLRCAAATPFTHNATSLICPGGANFNAVAGDVLLAVAKCTTSGTPDGWALVLLQRAASVPFTLSAFMATVLDDANAAAARATLGVPDAAVGGNALCNGDMGIWQRGTTSVSCPAATRTFRADRWAVNPAGAAITQARSSVVPSSSRARYSLQLDGAAGVTTVDVDQRIEAAEIAAIKRQVTFSFAVHNVTGAAFTPSLLLGTPAAADDFTTVTNRLTQVLASCPDNAWTTVSHTVDISAYTNLDNGLEVELRIPSGSMVAGDIVRITECQVRVSSLLVPFQPEPMAVALARCLRFYEVVRVVARGTVGFAGGLLNTMGNFRVAKVKAPTLTPFGSVVFSNLTVETYNEGTVDGFRYEIQATLADTDTYVIGRDVAAAAEF